MIEDPVEVVLVTGSWIVELACPPGLPLSRVADVTLRLKSMTVR